MLGLVVAAALVLALFLTGRWLSLDGGSGPPARPTATGAGRAPPPAGALEVDGVQLVPTSGVFRASCQESADRLGFTVPCPLWLPVQPSGSVPSRLCQDPRECRRGQLLSFTFDGFVVPDGYVGAPGRYGALVILATPARGADAERVVPCPNQRAIATSAVQRRPVLVVACPEGTWGWSIAGVAVRWSQQGSVVVLGLRGSSERNQRLVVALADRMRLVAPRS
jgi:hypothetical protein